MVKYLFIGSVFLAVACSVYRQAPTLILKNNTSEKIKLSGYFYVKKDNNLYNSIVLYQNGIVLEGGSSEVSAGINSVDSNFLATNNFNNSYDRKIPYIWGIYSINENYIIIERYKVPAFGESYQTYVDKGHIINERQFIITSRKYIKTGKLEARRDTFNFRPFSTKPDSTNNFIK